MRHKVKMLCFGAVLAVLVTALVPSVALAAFGTVTMPNVGSPPVSVYTHGDGHYTIANYSCPGYNNDPNSLAVNAVTYDGLGASSQSQLKIYGAFQTQPCYNRVVAGPDGALYTVQRGTAGAHYPTQIIARRHDVTLWTQGFPTRGCSSQKPSIISPTLGPDGNLYMVVHWSYWSAGCPEREAFASIDAGSGAIRFQVDMPYGGANARDNQMKTVLPYDGGVAVLNGHTVRYYDYDGSLLSGSTFTPSLAGGATLTQLAVVPETGRTYVTTSYYASGGYVTKLYRKDPGSSTITEITLPSGRTPGMIFATPGNGLVLTWRVSSNSTFGFIYYDSSDAVVYDQTTSSEPNAIMQDTVLSTGSVVVDGEGNVVIRRTVQNYGGNNDRNVLFDSYSPTGTATRLFSTASIGTSGNDYFNRTGTLVEGLSEDQLYTIVCHSTSYASTCNSNPIALKISRNGGFDLIRGDVFGAQEEKLNYVAMGDSYSSGEGDGPFIPPSDVTQGCHRSGEAYPNLVADELDLAFRAFVACSAATIADVQDWFKGNSPQQYSLNADTDIVTLSAGGNDVGFGNYATQCVEFTCSNESLPYTTAMGIIDTNLQALLEDLLDNLRSEAPNAKIFLVGYPQVAPPPGISCTFLSDSERTATRTMVAALNAKMEEAVDESGLDEVYFVDPTQSSSPFEGFEYCMFPTYFTDVDPFNTEGSLHPNEAGHGAYSELVVSAIEDALE